MKKFLVAATVAIGSCAALSFAAPPAFAGPPVYNWTGCYIGGNVGGAWASQRFTDENNFFHAPGQSDGSGRASGFAGGGQIGCDYQFANNWVIGIQGMWDGARINGRSAVNDPTGAFFDTRIRDFGMVTGRLGYLFKPALLFYGKAGVGWADDRFSCTTGTFCSGTNPPDQLNARTTRSGLDLGVGLSWMFTPNWDLWVEYDHMSFGSKNVNWTTPGPGGITFISNIHQDLNAVLIGLDYRFGGR
jgi:outer membrane immunogenic protein